MSALLFAGHEIIGMGALWLLADPHRRQALVLLETDAAGHGATVSDAPDRAVPHLTFGHGPRHCVGAPWRGSS